MKIIERKNIIDLPYSLHDARVNKINVVSDKVIMYFDEGYYKIYEDELIKGYIEFGNVDLDFCSISVFDSQGGLGKLSGERFSLQYFSQRFKNLDLEIVEETYGYNKSKFFGYIYEEDLIKECIIEIYHFDNMKYITEE